MHIDNFLTPLGPVELTISFKSESYAHRSQTGASTIIQSPNLSIEVITFTDVSNWTRDSDFPVEETKGWIIRISKTTDEPEQVEISCRLNSDNPDILSSPDSGEHLDAIWIENKTHFLSIGTEDGEMLKRRAEQSDYMPERFASELGFQFERCSFTSYLALGLHTVVPELRKGERIYFHYLAAVNQRRKSTQYPDEDDISTNFAVDFPKRTLIKRLGIRE